MFTTILFDIDGVMLSEERYFDASALTVFELLSSRDYLSFDTGTLGVFKTDVSNEDIARIRHVVFAGDVVLNHMKQAGINANWDMVYLQTATQILQSLRKLREVIGSRALSEILRTVAPCRWDADALRALSARFTALAIHFVPDFAAFNEEFQTCRTQRELFMHLDDELSRLCEMAPGIARFSAENALWEECKNVFQEWYLGDAYTSSGSHRLRGKRGFLNDEIPIVPPGDLKHIFEVCIQKGIAIGIATGRPDIETRVPLEAFGWLSYFSPDRVSTASDVLHAEECCGILQTLSKPHPYSYLRSYLRESNPQNVLKHRIPLGVKEREQTLIVGDSVADCLAAKAMGTEFAAVLTGLEGEAARATFEQLGASYIWNDVRGIHSII